MKKLLVLTILLTGLISIASAQVCKISDSGDNVEVFGAVIEDGNTVVITVGNDSQNNSANVTVTVEVIYEVSSVKEVVTGKVIAKPNQESIIRISIPEKKGNRKPTSVKVTGISGNKCL